MCIVFFMDHPHRHGGHVEGMGIYLCRSNICPPDSFNRFHLEESGYGCQKCIAIEGDKLNPDATPVRYYPPVEDFDIAYVRQGAFDRVVKVPRDVSQRSERSLSDVDSETSHWKEDWTTDEEDGEWECSDEGTLFQEESSMPVATGPQLPATTADTAQERDIAQDKFAHRPQHLAPDSNKQSAPSPNTTQHRNLVQDQLAHLPNHLAHYRLHANVPVSPIVPAVPYYGPPVVAVPGVPIPATFYNNAPGGGPQP